MAVGRRYAIPYLGASLGCIQGGVDTSRWFFLKFFCRASPIILPRRSSGRKSSLAQCFDLVPRGRAVVDWRHRGVSHVHTSTPAL